MVRTQKKADQTPVQPRVRKLSRKNKKKVVRTSYKLPSSFTILRRALAHIWHNKKLFIGILLIFTALYLLLVKGLAVNFRLEDTGDAIEDAVGQDVNPTLKGAALLGALLGSPGSTTGEAASVYQVLLLILVSLPIIWALRQTFDGRTKISVKEAYYHSMAPFVQYIFVGLVILVQCLPAIIMISVYNIVIAQQIATNDFEHALWLIGALLGIGVSFYFLSASIFASYIVTLPNMRPMESLRSALKLVKFRRWMILRKVLFLFFVMLLCYILLFLPLVLLVPIAAEILFLFVSVFLLLLGHTYFYTLYRELL